MKADHTLQTTQRTLEQERGWAELLQRKNPGNMLGLQAQVTLELIDLLLGITPKATATAASPGGRSPKKATPKARRKR